ncbi:MAG: FlgD immunoglobulin-like domain containing protein [candidate division WOR-3 bacterium]
MRRSIIITAILCLSTVAWAQIVWEDGFESYPVGQFPNPPWIPSGNGNSSDCYVDSTVRYAGVKSLKLYGVVGAFWGALAHRPLQTSAPYLIEFMVRNGSEQIPPQGHQGRGGLSVRTGPDWTYPGRDFLSFHKNDTIYGMRGPLQTYSTLTWYRVRVRYERPNPNSVRVTYWINDAMYGPFDDTAFSYENDLNYVDLTVGAGTAWFDEVKIFGESVQRQDIEACFTQQWGSNFAPINIFGKPVNQGQSVQARLWPIDPSGNPGYFRYFRDFFPDSTDFSWRTHPTGNRWELNKSFISRMYKGGLAGWWARDTIWVFVQFAGAEGYHPGCAGYVRVRGDSWRISSVIRACIVTRGGGFGWRVIGDTLFEWEGRDDVPAAACREANWRFLVELVRREEMGIKAPSERRRTEEKGSLHIKPNLINSDAVIEFTVPYPSHINLTISDISGKVVRNLSAGEKIPGRYGISWDGKDERGINLPAGTYFVTLTINGTLQTKKAVVIK